MKHLLLAARNNAEDHEAMTLAIEVVGAANDDILANQLIELLLGEVDGEARVRANFYKNVHILML